MWPFKRTKWEKLGNPWTGSAVSDRLRALSPRPAIILPPRDMDYRSIPHKDFEALLFDCWFPKDYMGYRPEIWDCDNWTLSCMARVSERWAKVSKGKEALAFGYIDADIEGMGYHEFVWHMDEIGHVAYYEPQWGRKVDYKLTGIGLMGT